MCDHQRISFKTRFIVKAGYRLLDVSGWCGDCGAAVLFVPKPTLSIDDETFQIPMRMGPPDEARLIEERMQTAAPVHLGGPRKAMN
jgi:hypothetical protein